MAHQIFLSHNHNDKPLVEAIAVKLADIFSQDQVFYDSWSIRPGDGIIDKINTGLEAPEVVFFFVSANSLASDMVKLEWQSALYEATKGKTRLIPVRVDGSDMPAVLKQTFFIDMHTLGLDAATHMIVDAIQGDSHFTPQHQGFSNLTYSYVKLVDGTIEITVRASHLMEPNPHFAFPLINEKDEVGYWIKGHPGIYSSFHESAFELNEGGMANAVLMKPTTGPLTPSHPITFELRQKGEKELNLVDVLHDKGQDGWAKVPKKAPIGQT